MSKNYIITEEQKKALLTWCEELSIKQALNIYQFLMQLPEEGSVNEDEKKVKNEVKK